MKKSLVILTMILAMNAEASLKFFNSSDLQLGIKSEFKCGTNLTCSIVNGKVVASVASLSLTGDVVGDGGDQLYGFLNNQVASTTTGITAAQCGSTFVSNSADVMTLPEASTVLGCRLTFVCGTADDFDVNPADATDVIGITGSITGSNTTTVLAPSAGDAIRCTDIGAGFTLEAVGANLWAVLSTNGIITDVN